VPCAHLVSVARALMNSDAAYLYNVPREPVSDLLAGGGVQGCGACPGREPVAVGEPGDVADVGQDPGGDDRADAGQVHQVRAAGNDQDLEPFAGRLHLLLHDDHLGELLERCQPPRNHTPCPRTGGTARSRA
jgi:hypothetical protein